MIAILLIVFGFWLVVVTEMEVEAETPNKDCNKHGGVAQISGPYLPLGHEEIICKDGYVNQK